MTSCAACPGQVAAAGGLDDAVTGLAREAAAQEPPVPVVFALNRSLDTPDTPDTPDTREILRNTKLNKSTHAACLVVSFEPLIPKLFLYLTYDDSFRWW